LGPEFSDLAAGPLLASCWLAVKKIAFVLAASCCLGTFAQPALSGQRVKALVAKAKRLHLTGKVKRDFKRARRTGQPGKYAVGDILSTGRRATPLRRGGAHLAEETFTVGSGGKLSRAETVEIATEPNGHLRWHTAVEHALGRREVARVDGNFLRYQLTVFDGQGRSRTPTFEKRTELSFDDQTVGVYSEIRDHKNGSLGEPSVSRSFFDHPYRLTTGRWLSTWISPARDGRGIGFQAEFNHNAPIRGPEQQ
jgi:hypothetical protein